VEESNKKIIEYRTQLQEIDKFINSKNAELKTEKDVDIKVQKEMLNRMLAVLANNRKEDLTILFLKTKNLIKDDKKVLGIEYTNFVDIDKGQVKMDLKSLKLIRLEKNKMEAIIEIGGNGDISLSGKNTGISASISSGVDLYLKDNVEFKIENSNDGNIILRPIPKKMKLKTKFTIELLKWNIPWREEIELEFSDIISPISVPMSLATEIDFPFPSKSKKPGQFNYIPCKINFFDTKALTESENLIWMANINIMKIK